MCASGNRDKYEKKGFTLAELLIVVAIIAVLVAVSVPLFIHKLDSTREHVCESNRKTLIREIQYRLSGGDTFEDRSKIIYIDELDGEAYCPSGGQYQLTMGDFSITISCDKHGDIKGGALEPEETVSQGILVDYKNYAQECISKNPNISNDKLRKQFYEKCGNQWPILEVDGREYTIQPFYKEGNSGHPEDQVWLFASSNFDASFSSNNWYTGYVYNTKDKAWYMAVKPNGKPGATSINVDKNIEELDNAVRNGTNPSWVKLTDFKEKGL